MHVGELREVLLMLIDDAVVMVVLSAVSRHDGAVRQTVVVALPHGNEWSCNWYWHGNGVADQGRG